MRKGFTIAEALITMGIIGLIAVLVIPAISKARPDGLKSKYLKTYDALSNTIKAFANNSGEYPLTGPDSANENATMYDMGKFPLLNLYQSTGGSISGANAYSGTTKLCKLLAWAFNAENNTCSESILNKNPVAATKNDFVLSFVANNGVQFSVRPRTIEIKKNAKFGENIMIDINGDKEPNCMYNADSCKHPDRFWFFLTADGNLTPADPMGKYYIDTRKDPFKKQENPGDYTAWENLINIDPILTNCDEQEEQGAEEEEAGAGDGNGDGDGDGDGDEYMCWKYETEEFPNQIRYAAGEVCMEVWCSQSHGFYYRDCNKNATTSVPSGEKPLIVNGKTIEDASYYGAYFKNGSNKPQNESWDNHPNGMFGGNRLKNVVLRWGKCKEGASFEWK